MLPWCNTEAMGLHLAEISARVTPGKHCALLVDQAGWHVSERLIVPQNVTIVPLPAKCPELNPVENVWQFMRGNWLSNRVFMSYTAIVDHCCDAWNRLADQPWRVMSIGLRQWVPSERYCVDRATDDVPTSSNDVVVVENGLECGLRKVCKPHPGGSVGFVHLVPVELLAPDQR